MSIQTTGSSRSQELILIGTVHTDIASFETVVSILESFDPSIIALETHLYSISFRLGPGARLRGAYRRFLRTRGVPADRGGELSCRLAHLRIPFEYCAARTVARRSEGVAIVHLGRKRDAIAGLSPLLRESLDSDWLHMLSSTGKDHVDKLRAAVAAAVADRTGLRKSGIRDAIMARRLMELMNDGHRVIALSGWEHLSLSKPGNVYHRLNEYDPERIVIAGGEILG